jgi:predicted  nucleic acid-binding Zn-ribbon protein
MKWIRCKDCGMLIKANDYDFMANCPICDTKIFVQSADEIRSLNNSYNTHRYCNNHVDNSNIRDVNNSVNNGNVYKNKSSNNKANVKGNPVAISIFIFIFVIFFILSVVGGL